AAARRNKQNVRADAAVGRCKQFSADYDDQSDCRRNADTRKDEWRRARKTNTAENGGLLLAEAPGGLGRNGINVVDAVDGIKQDWPRGRISDQNDLHGEPLSPQQNSKRD